ncbi:hypothetical protein BVX97_00490 [bacterium E08(2017)]|nr:hypothetical protein BVX97_00490 [bacterium E08(2017)]
MIDINQNGKKDLSTNQKRAAKVQEIATDLPSATRRFGDAYARKSRKSAIEAFCIECMGFENVVYEIRNCTAPCCPLYEYRPYQK